MEERRGARAGTVSGLALLAGGTAVAAVAGGAHSIYRLAAENGLPVVRDRARRVR